MSNEAANDICTALMRLRQAFAMHNIPCPDVLEWSDAAKAYDAIPRLRSAMSQVTWAMDSKASSYGEMSLAGFTVRFEARRIEHPGTGDQLDDGISNRVFGDGDIGETE